MISWGMLISNRFWSVTLDYCRGEIVVGVDDITFLSISILKPASRAAYRRSDFEVAKGKNNRPQLPKDRFCPASPCTLILLGLTRITSSARDEFSLSYLSRRCSETMIYLSGASHCLTMSSTLATQMSLPESFFLFLFFFADNVKLFKH